MNSLMDPVPIPSSSRAPVSQVIAGFLMVDESPRFPLMALAAALENRAFGVLLILFALPNLIPLPGLSTVCGLPIAWLGGQMALGLTIPWLPARFAGITFERALFRQLMARVEPRLAWVERRLRPRLFALTSRPAERVLGMFLVVLGITLALPIPFGNGPPGVAVALTALGLMERDGVLVLVGVVTGVLALALAGSVVAGMAGGAILVWQHLV